MSNIQKVLAAELDIRSYVTELGLNPDNVFYQSVTARNVSTANAGWTITSPNKRSFLLSYAAVNWQPTIQAQQEDGTPEDWGAALVNVSAKPNLAFSNAMSSITLSLNGNTITLSQPRRFMEALTMMNVTKEESRVCFESSYPDSMGGLYSRRNPGGEIWATVDDSFIRNEVSMYNKILRAQGANAFAAFGTDGVALTGNNGFQEPLIVPPFNPFAKLKDGMPGYMWFKQMSPVIGNIDRLELDIQFTNLVQSAFYPRWIQAATNANEFKRIGIASGGAMPAPVIAADLKLYWYEVPVNMSIPRSIDLQTWNVREYQTAVTPTVAPGVAFARITSDLIQLNSTPTLIMVHIERDKDGALYQPICPAKADTLGVLVLDGAAATDALALAGAADPSGIASLNGSVANAGLHSWDSFAEITNLEILLGDRPNVISTNFTQKELYYLTQKNSKSPYPYSYNDWRSVVKPTTDVSNRQLPTPDYGQYASKCVICLRPKDLAERIPDGVFAPNSFQVRVNGVARDGTHGYGAAAVNQTYRMYVHLFFGKHFLRIEPDKAQFQEQSIPLDTARQLLNPVLESQGVSGLGSGLQGIRLRSEQDPGYQSRV